MILYCYRMMISHAEFNLVNYFPFSMWGEEQQTNDTLNGQLYEGYEVLEVIGTGTFGKVYKVRQQTTGKVFAMKHVLQNKKYKNRELDIMTKIESQYVVKLHHHFCKEQKKGLFLNLVMEYVPDPLNKIVKGNIPYKKYLSTPTIIAYTKCLLTALRDLHKSKICHRDIKPSNILVDGIQAKLCDFGSAKILDDKKSVAYICSRYYRAPELLFGAVFYSEQVDIWSLGCVLAEMITNRVLFQGINTNSMLSKIIRCIGAPTPEDLQSMNIKQQQQVIAMEGTGLRNRILKLNPNSPQELIGIVEKMVIYNPQKRITALEALSLPIFN